MKKLHAQRLLNVATALRESPNPEKFTMVEYSDGCGSPACALGHYAARRDLQSFLRLGTNGALHSAKEDSFLNRVSYCNRRVLEHFGITSEETDELFSGCGCDNAKTPLAAARYIERFLDRKGWEFEYV